MKHFLRAAVVLAATLFMVGVSAATAGPVRITTSFDDGWSFFKGEAKGAHTPEFDDSKWRTLSVPHDWSIEGPFSKTNRTGDAGGYLPSGVGWYRKAFSLPTNYVTRKVFIDFEGIMGNSEVWINGSLLGKRPNGYVGFRYELTSHLRFMEGETNVLVVRADTSAQPASRWYSGAGIYRHVRLVVTDPVHIAQSGVFVSTSKIGADHALIRVQTTVTNQSPAPREVFLQASLFGPGGQLAQLAETRPQIAPPGKTIEIQQEITVSNPQFWDLEHPNLYRIAALLRSGTAVLDDEVVALGIREARFDASTGFVLNGKPIKLKGVCLHHDAGALGVAVPLRAWERRLEQLKLIGCNAIRTTHNPVNPDFLDLCDRMGFVVMDELFDCWAIAKTPYDYHLYFKDWAKVDLRDTISRDRNHPSIVLYSIGNEIPDMSKAVSARKTLLSLRDTCRQADPTRPVTQALAPSSMTRDYANGLADLLDVIGQNDKETELLAAHKKKPFRKIIGTENAQDRKSWLALRDNAPYAGQFLWNGIDYLGKGKWPAIGIGSGLLDRTGTPRPQAFERRSWWTDQPMVHIARRFPAAPVRARKATSKSAQPAPQEDSPVRQTQFSDWTPKNKAPHDETVEVYSNCEQVELFLNGKSLGLQARLPDDAPRSWQVPFEPGVIKAIGKNYGQPVAGHELRTAGPAASIILSADRNPLTPDWDDVCYIKAVIVDKEGVLVPSASDLISFKIEGPGTLIAVDSGDNNSHESFQAEERRAYNGQCFAIIKASAGSGQIEVTATTTNFPAASVTIDTVERR